MDLKSLSNPRRIVTAAVLFLLLMGGGTAVASAGGEGDAPAAAEPFELPALSAGVAGEYAIERYYLDRPGQVIEGRSSADGETRFTFDVRGTRPIVTAAGSFVDTFEIGYNDTSRLGEHESSNDDWPTERAILVDASGMPRGRLVEWIEEETEETAQGPVVSRSDSWSLEWRVRSHPCGLVNPLQGGERARGDVAVGGSGCLGDGTVMAAYQVLEILEGSDGRYLHVALVGPSEGVSGQSSLDAVYGHLWFKEGIAVPVRMDVSQAPLDGRGWMTVHRLVGYSGPTIMVGQSISTGISGASSEPSRPMPEAFAPVYAPPTPWMFDETGIGHQFPVSEAYRVALADPTTGLAEYLAANPDAYITDASYWEYRDEAAGRDVLRHEWRLAWRAEDTIHYVDIGKRDPAEDLLGLGLNETAVYYYFEPSHRPLSEYGPMAALPAALPTVATMWAYYEALSSAEAHGLGPNMWGWAIFCCDTDDQPRFVIGAGRFQDTPSPTSTTVTYEREWAYLEYEYTRDQLPFRYNERFRTDTVDNDPRPVMSSSAGGFAAMAFEAPDEGFWSIPEGKTVAVVGAGASVLALLYYFWPALKLFGVGLFSRVQPDKALDHPLRRELYEHIQDNPGTHYQQLIRSTGKGRGTVDHHLQKLQQAGLVTVRRNQGYTCYYTKGSMDPRLMDAQAAMKSPVAAGILETIQAQPGIRTGDLASRLGVSAPTVSYHLKRLREAGLVDAMGRGHAPTALAHRLQDT